MTRSDTKETWLLAGAARVDITPPMGTQLAGDIGRYRPVKDIRDRLYAGALVLDGGGRRACVLSLDLLAAANTWSDRIRKGAAEALGIEPKDVVVHVVQNHASPSLGHCFFSEGCPYVRGAPGWFLGGDDAYHQPTVDRCIEAVRQAGRRLQPVVARVGRRMDGRVAFNRRFVMRDGSASTHPPACDPNILHVEGPTDPEVGVLTFSDQAGDVTAVLLHHTCHPCTGFGQRTVVAADWPGAWAQHAVEHFGPQCVPLVINGCCGNVHSREHLNPHWRADYPKLGRLLWETASGVLGRLEPVTAGPVDVRRKVLRMPLRKLTDEQVAAARRIIKDRPEPPCTEDENVQGDWDWVFAAMTLDLKDTRDRDPLCDYEIQVLRVGSFAMATLMGEPFVEAQLRIKLKSPAPYTFVAHFCNGYAGYVPTRRAFERGGYETRAGNSSKWTPDALDHIADETIRLLQRTFA